MGMGGTPDEKSLGMTASTTLDDSTVAKRMEVVLADDITPDNDKSGSIQPITMKKLEANKVVLADDITANNTTSSDDTSKSIGKSHDEKLAEIQKEFVLPETPDYIPLQPQQRLVVIGDIHGRCDVLLTCLTESGIISPPLETGDANNDKEQYPTDWIGGNTVLVQVGDLLDRGDREEDCIRLLAKLGRQAQQHGGSVVVLWGNHEAWNAERGFVDCLSDKTAFEETFGDLLDSQHGGNTWREKSDVTSCPVRFRTLCPGGLLAKPFLSKLKVSVKVGKTVLVHAGLTVDHVRHFGGIQAMNEAAKEWILDPSKVGPDTCPDCLDSPGPLWMRDYSMGPLGDDVQGKVDAVLEELGADRLVVGHTVQSNGVNSILNGKVWRVDIGVGCSFCAWTQPSGIDDDMYCRGIALQVTQEGGAAAVQRKGKWRTR